MEPAVLDEDSLARAPVIRTYSVEELIQAIRAQAKVPFQIEQDKALMRGCDEPVIAGDITRFQHSTGWSPQIDLARTLQDMLDWWRHRLAPGSAAVPAALTDTEYRTPPEVEDQPNYN